MKNNNRRNQHARAADPEGQKILYKFCTKERYHTGQEDVLRVHKAENDHLYPREKLQRAGKGMRVHNWLYIPLPKAITRGEKRL